jgi:spermidine synthase
LSVSNVFTVDYIGALGASLLFPIVLVPQLGLLRTSLFFGLLNLSVAAIALYSLREKLVKKGTMTIATVIVGIALGVGFFSAGKLSSYFENRFYTGEIIYAETTPYQRIVISRDQHVISMFINGALQFNTLDEYRYHEALVHPAMNHSRYHENVLVLGGGDGMVVREVLKYPDVKSITLVDIDPAITRIFRDNALLRKLNDNALNNDRVNIVNEDAWRFIEDTKNLFDIVIIDLPDPNDIGLSKLYSRAFYADLSRRLSAGGVIVTQATSPLFTREAYWCIKHTLDTVPSPLELQGWLNTLAYHVYVPTFGEWGFVMASPRPLDWSSLKVQVDTRYLDETVLPSLVRFPRDMDELQTEINTLQEHKLAYYYERGWAQWYR